MCGLAAILSRDESRVSAHDLRLMSSALAHRGPDEAGYALLDNHRVGFGHVRLSIVDLESGQQPLHNEDESITLICNGEIYDYRQHRERLIAQGHRFRTKSDSEVILHLYEQYGLDFVSRLNGEFAFLLWDQEQRHLVAGRDRHGIKPLYYLPRDGELLFASEVKGLYTLDRVERGFSPTYLAASVFGVWNPGNCLFDGVRSVKPGHLLVATERNEEEYRWYQPRYDSDSGVSFPEACERVRDEVTAAVRRRMVADVPVHAYLSGGLDSTIVSGLLAQQRSDVTAYTIGFPDSAYDESVSARLTANRFGIENEVVPCTNAAIAENVSKGLYHVEMPLTNYNSIAKMMLSEHVRSKGQKVCLTGEGADEMFAGYPYFRLEELWRKELDAAGSATDRRRLWKKFLSSEARSEGYLWSRLRGWKDRSRHPFGFPSYYEMRSRFVAPFSKLFLNLPRLGITEAQLPDKQFQALYSADTLKDIHPLNATKQITFDFLAQLIIPSLGDRVEMANSLECRTPFLDPNVSDLANSLPPGYLLDANQLREKHVLREAFRDLLPPANREATKHPFLSPNWKTFSRQKAGREIFNHYLSAAQIRKTGLFRLPAIAGLRAYWEYFPKPRALRHQSDSLIGLFLSLQILHELFVENRVRGDRKFPMADLTPSSQRCEARPENCQSISRTRTHFE